MLIPVLALMLAGALAEVATIGALLPFLSVIANPGDSQFLAFILPLLPLHGEAGAVWVVPVLIGVFGLAVLISAGLRLVLLWTSTSFVNGMAHELATQLYVDTLHEPYAFHTTRNSSEIIAVINKVQILTWQVLNPLMSGVIAFTISCFIVGGLIIVDARIALLAGTGFVSVYVVATLLTRERLKRNSVIIARAASERIKTMQDGLGGIRDVLLDHSQAVFVDAYDRAEARYRAASVKTTFLGGAPRFVVEAGGIIMIAAIAAAVVGGHGGLAAGVPVLGALALGAQRLLPLMQQTYGAWASIMGSRQVVLDIVALLSRPTRTVTPVRAPLPFTQAIALRNVSFAYGPELAPALSGVNFEIRKGARIGIAGKTGSGKSTLVDLVLGLLEPSAGELCVDGVPVTDENRLGWQRNVAHVPQAIYLADASVAENIAFGVPPESIDRDRVRRAAGQAELAEVVAALPRGYDTRVGERGIQLSGGQRQRIGIARALYKQASVLVFDEATSALDTETEAIVMAAINRLDRRLTIIIIAHRLSTLDACDAIVWLEAGRIRSIANRSSETRKVLP